MSSILLFQCAVRVNMGRRTMSWRYGIQTLCGNITRFLHAGRVRSEFTASVNFNPAFRELEWQDLHAASLQLLGHSIQALLSGSNTGETSAKIAAVWKVCRLFCPCCILSKAKTRKGFYSHRENLALRHACCHLLSKFQCIESFSYWLHLQCDRSLRKRLCGVTTVRWQFWVQEL